MQAGLADTHGRARVGRLIALRAGTRAPVPPRAWRVCMHARRAMHRASAVGPWPVHEALCMHALPLLLAGKWARGGWAASDDDERRVKEETQATLRCFPFEQPAGPHTCLMTGKPALEAAIFAKSY